MNRKKWLTIKLILLILVLFLMGMIALNLTGLKSLTAVGGEERTFTNVEKIVVESISLSVKIIETDGTIVTIKDNSKGYGIRAGKPNILKQEDGVVTFKQGKGIFFLSFVTGNVVVEVPRGSLLEYDVKSISGNIDHDAMSGESLQASSISGDIEIHQGGEKASVETTSGSVRVHAPFEKVKAESVSGSIRLTADQNSKEVKTSAISGSIRIQLKKVLGYTMDYSSTSGSVKDTYDNIDYSKSGHAIRGDSALDINVSTISGSIKLADWND